MNKRLQNLHSSIKKANGAKFLSNEIELDKTWGKSIWGVTLQIELSDEVKNKIVSYQKLLGELEHDNLLMLPCEYQHISFNQVVFWGGDYKLGKEATWSKVSNSFISAFESLDSKYDSFRVVFYKLIATSGAIIFVAYDEKDEMEKLRNIFFKKLPFPNETTKRNHIIHTTLARYKNKLNDPRKVMDFVDRQSELIKMNVNKITLKKELVFPSIKTQTIAEIKLISFRDT